MKKTNVIYWIFTGLLSATMLMSAISGILNQPAAVAMISTHLGYPVYFIPFTVVAKILGVIAILIPGFPRIKEWAYAGLSFDLIAALYSAIAVGDPAKQWVFMFIFFIPLVGSYIFYHKKLKTKALSTANK